MKSMLEGVTYKHPYKLKINKYNFYRSMTAKTNFVSMFYSTSLMSQILIMKVKMAHVTLLFLLRSQFNNLPMLNKNIMSFKSYFWKILE